MAATNSYTYYTINGKVDNFGYDNSGWVKQPSPATDRRVYEDQSSINLKVNADGLAGGRALFSNADYSPTAIPGYTGIGGSAIRFGCHQSVGPSLFVHDTDFLNNKVHDVNGTGGTGTICAGNANRAEIVNCTFTGNYASIKGSAISLCNSETKDILNVSLIEDCTFTNNTGGGSAVFVSDASTVTNCVFKGNQATVLKATDKVGAIHCDTPLSSKYGIGDFRHSTLLVQGSRFEKDTDGIYVTKTHATFKGHNYMAGNIIGENTIWVDKHGTNHSIAYSVKIENDTTSPETIANSKLEFLGKKISANISGGVGSTIQFKNSGNYTYENGVQEGDAVAYSHEVQVNGTFTGVENIVFNGVEPIRFDGGFAGTQLVGNVKNAKSLTIENDAVVLGGTDLTPHQWDPHTVATGIVFEPHGSTNTGKFTDLKIVVEGITIAENGQPKNSLLSIVNDNDNDGPDYIYRFNHTTGTGENAVTRTYGLLHHDTYLILTEIKVEDLFVNSWYENIYMGGHNKINENIIGGVNLSENADMIGIHEFAYLTINDGTFTSNTVTPFTGTRYKSINKAYDNLAGTNVYVTGGTFSSDQFGYGANLVVCDDQRSGLEITKNVETKKAVNVFYSPNRKSDLQSVNPSAPGNEKVTNGKSVFKDDIEKEYFLFGGADLTVDSAGQVLGTHSRSVSIYAGLSGKGVFTGDRITVKASGGSMTLQNTKLVVKKSVAGYESSTVETSPDCQLQLLMGGSYILGGSTAGEAYAMTLDQGSTITIDKTAADLAVSLYACAGSLVGNGNNELAMTLTGAPELKISSGTYNYLVAGGHLLQGNASSLILDGDTFLTIDGGSFTGNIYGGNISRFVKDATSDRLKMTGNTNVTIKVDGTTVDITGRTDGDYVDGKFGNIFGGSNGKGTVTGSTNITFQGDGNLDGSNSLIFTGAISGDSSGAGWFHENGVYGRYHYCTKGSRNLTFQDFDGNFNTRQVVCIDTITFKGNTRMTLTNEGLDLAEIENWNFEYSAGAADANLATLNCSAVAKGLNVHGDTLVVSGNLGSWVTDNSWWMLIDAKNNGLTGINNGTEYNYNFNSVTLFAATANFIASEDKWTASVGSDVLTLKFDRTNGNLALGKNII